MVPSDPDKGPDEPRRRVRVPVRRGDGIDDDEYAEVGVDVAGQWDARVWRDSPL